MTAFQPDRHGFRFTNSFTTIVLPTVLLGGAGSQALAGLCGGMTFAALDYFNAGLPVPTHTSADYPGPSHVPPRGTRLWELILRRHLASVGLSISSFGVPVVLPPLTLQLNLADPHASLTFIQVSATPSLLLEPTLTAEIAKVKAAVRAGTPVPIVLVHKDGIEHSHQVVVTGFDDSVAGSVTLLLYDCRFPRKVSELTVNPTALACAQSTPGEAPDTWKAFFVNHYTPVMPAYQDLALTSGLAATLAPFPGSRTFDMSFTARNLGEVPARAGAIILAVNPEDPGGIPEEIVGTLAAGSDVSFSFPVDFPASMAGETVTVYAGYSDEASGAFVTLPKGSPAATPVVNLTVPLEF